MLRAITVSAAAVVLAGAARAQWGADLLGRSVPSMARAGAGLADTEGVLSVNPGALAFGKGLAMDSVVRTTFIPVRMEGGVQNTNSIGRLVPGGAWGMAGGAGGLRYGLQVAPTGGAITETPFLLKTNWPVDPPTSELVADSQIVYGSLTPRVAWQAMGGRLGLGLELQFLPTRFFLGGGIDQPVSVFQGDASSVGQPTYGDLMQVLGLEEFEAVYDMETDAAMALAGGFGAVYRWSEDLDLAFHLRSPSTASSLNGDVDVDMEDMFSPLLPFIPEFQVSGFQGHYNAEVRGYRQPLQIGIGAAWRPGPDWRWMTDVVWTQYSKGFGEWVFHLTEGDNDAFNLIVGDDVLDVVLPLDWADSFGLMTGVDWAVAPGWTGHAGFAWTEVPGPASTFFPQGPALSRAHLGLGVTRRTRSGAWHLGWLHSLPETIRIDSSEIADEFDGVSVTAGVDAFAFGWTLRF